jgi:hypothetical protein
VFSFVPPERWRSLGQRALGRAVRAQCLNAEERGLKHNFMKIEIAIRTATHAQRGMSQDIASLSHHDTHWRRQSCAVPRLPGGC